MSNHQEQEHLQEEFPDVLDELAKIRGAVDSRVYPGSAWPVRRSGFRRFVRPTIAAAAAAILAAGLVWWLHGTRYSSGAKEALQVIVEASSEDETTWAVPTGISLSLAGSVKLEIPTVSMPSGDDFGELAVPAISFLSLDEERSDNHDLE